MSLLNIENYQKWGWKIKSLADFRMSEVMAKAVPANTRLDEDILKTSFVFVFGRRLEDVFKTNMFALALRLQDVFKTSWSRPIYSSWLYVFKTSSRRFQDVFKTFSRRLQDIFKTSCQDVFKTSCKNVFKTSSRRLAKTSSRHLQDVFKTYHQVKLFFLTRLWKAFNTFLRRSFPKMVIYRGICLSNTTSDRFMVSVPNLQER